MGGYRNINSEPLQQCYDEVYGLLLDGKIDPLVSQTVGMADLPRALKDLFERNTTGRVIFDPRL